MEINTVFLLSTIDIDSCKSHEVEGTVSQIALVRPPSSIHFTSPYIKNLIDALQYIM